MRKDIAKFVTAVLNGQNKTAHNYLKKVIDEKIKQKIINNNSNLF